MATLDLTDTSLDDAKALHLCRLPALDWLKVEGTGIGGGGLARLAAGVDPRRINVLGTRATPTGVAHVRLARPCCDVAGAPG